MPAAPAPRRASPSTRARRAQPVGQRRPSSRIRRGAVTLLLAAAGVLTALAVMRTLQPGTSGAVRLNPIEYTAVAGDTSQSVGSLFAIDPAVVARQAGAIDIHDPLTAGQQIAIDPGPLWKQVGQGPLTAVASVVEGTARRMGVEPALALAVAWQESRLDQSARSETGAVGVMQVEPDTGRLAARDLGMPIDITRLQDNVTAGVFWLRSLLASYAGERSPALAAYYEGPGNLARQGYFSGTYGYVAHVLAVREALLEANGSLNS